METWSVIIAVSGTLLGTALGGYIAFRTNQAQRKHEDRTRFHSVRLDAYAQFMAATSTLYSKLQLDATTYTKLDMETQREILEAKRRLLASHDQITLIATETTASAADALLVLVKTWKTADDAAAGIDELVKLRDRLRSAIREEFRFEAK